MVNHSLRVQTTFKSKYRLLLLHYKHIEIRKKTRCPSIQWMRTMVQCLLFHSNGEMKNRSRNYSIDIEWDILSMVPSYFQHSPIAMVFAILTVPNKNVWPLHIQTIRNTSITAEPNDTQWHTNSNEFDIDINAYLIFIIVIICGLAAGFLCGLCKMLCEYGRYSCKHCSSNGWCSWRIGRCKPCSKHNRMGQEVLNR